MSKTHSHALAFETGGSYAVQSQRVEPKDSLDDFPTPPWATRALMEKLVLKNQSVWEPACGRAIMAETLAEQAGMVIRSDIADYGVGSQVIDFLETGWEFKTDWIITNPPFNLAMAFALKALTLAQTGVAILARTNWIEGGVRYRKLFQPQPPSFLMPFCERVPMVRGCYDPGAGSATSYAWFVWVKGLPPDPTRVRWIKPGRKQALFRDSDLRFAPPKDEWPSEIRKALKREKRRARQP